MLKALRVLSMHFHQCGVLVAKRKLDLSILKRLHTRALPETVAKSAVVGGRHGR